MNTLVRRLIRLPAESAHIWSLNSASQPRGVYKTRIGRGEGDDNGVKVADDNSSEPTNQHEGTDKYAHLIHLNSLY